MIDWKEITDFYNKTHSRNHSTAEMLEYLYSHMGTVDKVANYIGVDWRTIANKMDKLGLTRPHRTTYNHKRPLIDRIMAIPEARRRTMTAKEIAKEVDCAKGTISQYARKHGFRYKTTTNKTLLERGNI